MRCFESRPLGMAGEGERPEAPPSWSSMANKQPQKAPAAAAILGWLLSLAAARGVQRIRRRSTRTLCCALAVFSPAMRRSRTTNTRRNNS